MEMSCSYPNEPNWRKTNRLNEESYFNEFFNAISLYINFLKTSGFFLNAFLTSLTFNLISSSDSSILFSFDKASAW